MNYLAIKIGLFVCVFLCLAVGDLFSQEQDDYKVRNFTKQEYNAEMQNWSICHDQNGYIFVANNIGLLEFDGIEWTFYPAPNGTIIRSVEVDRENRIFTSGYREIGYWERDDFGKLNYHSLNDIAEDLFSQNEEFWTIIITDERVYFHSFTSIFIYDYECFKLVRPGGLISSIGEVRGDVFIHIYDRGLFALKDTILESIIASEVIMQKMVQCILPYKNNGFLLGTINNGLYVYEDGKLSPYLEDWKEYFQKNTINRGLQTREGGFIIGTLLDGLIEFNSSGEMIRKVNRSAGLQNNTVLGMDITGEDELWISMDQGIDYINFQLDPSFTIYDFENVGAVYAAAIHKGYLYLCSNLGVFYRLEKEKENEFKFVAGTQGQAWDCKIFDDQLLVGHNSGTFLIESGEADRISDASGGMDIIRFPGHEEMLIQSSYTNLLLYENKYSKWEFNGRMPGFSELLRYIEIDHLNHIWAGHMRRGIYKLIPGSDFDSIIKQSYFGKETFGKDYDIQVFKLENRILFTTGNIIYTYNDLNDSIIPYTILNQQLGEYANAHRIVSGPDHHYWLISKTGIALFRIFENNFKKIKEYPAGLFQDHLIIGYENIFPIDRYRAILCLDNGYAILNAAQPDLSKSIVDRKLTLKAIGFRGINGPYESLPLAKELIKLPFAKNSLYLKFAFPSPPLEQIGFQFFIEGLDANWSAISDLPEFGFERLPPGEYKINVRATNRWNNSSHTETILLEISYPWYFKRISFLVYFIILVAGILFARNYLLLRIKIRERNIRNAKEKELIRLRNEKLNAELSYRSQELANSTMAIINKNQFLLKLKGILQRQKEELGIRYPDKYYREIIGRIDKNVSSIDDWKVFEFHFEKAHEKFLQKLMHKYPDLTHGDLRLCAYLRLNLSTKEIAPLLRISIRGVENHRYKLRKKLDLGPEENLTEFIMGF